MWMHSGRLFLEIRMHFAPLSALCCLVGKFFGIENWKKVQSIFYVKEIKKSEIFSDGIDDCYKDTIFFFIIHILNEGILQKIRYHDGGHKKFKGNEF